MTRKMLTAAIAVVALMLSVFALNQNDAEAQGPICTYAQAIAQPAVCAPALIYPGPFTNMPAAPCGAYGYGCQVPVAAAVTAPAAGGGDSAAPLAVTGSESTVLGYVGTGLIAFGAVAMGSRRKFFQGTLD